MTYFSIGGTRYTGEDIATFSLVFLVILAVIAVVVWVVAASVKEKDNSKPLQMGKVKILRNQFNKEILNGMLSNSKMVSVNDLEVLMELEF